MAQRKLGLVIAIGMAACGGGGDPDPGAADCHAFVARFCDRVVECDFGGLDEDACTEMSEDVLPGGCDEADGVAAGFPTCMSTMLSATCDELFPGGTSAVLPLECNQVILFEP